MKDEIISYETAKLAKEKRFDWRVYKMYGSQDNPQLEKYDDGICVMWDLTLAPTQSLLQRWLRNEHRIHVCSISQYNTNRQFQYYYVTVNGKSVDELEFDMYEQALEVGLQEGLKLITSKT